MENYNCVTAQKKHLKRGAFLAPKTRKELDKSDPNKTFEELLESKMKRKGLTREEALQTF